MKEWIAKYQKAITGVGAVSVLIICYLQQKELTKLRQDVIVQTNVTDSLRNEDFIKGTIITRYEIAIGHLKEVNPEVGSELEDWMSKHTE
jgi:hypothetical protein